MEELAFAPADSISGIKVMQIRDILSLAGDKKLNLQPEFQRRKVWPKEAKSYLIDTIVRGLPIPEIFAYREKNSNLAIVDGQQRLSTIIDFANGKIMVWVRSKIISFEQLDSQQQEEFLSYRLVFRVINHSDDFLIRDIFQRLNKHNVKLSRQELRHAIAEAGIIRLAEEYSQDRFWRTCGLIPTGGWSRMKEVEFVLELMVAVHMGPQHGSGKDLDRSLAKIDEANLNSIVKDYVATLDLAKRIFRDEKISAKFNRADFYSLFLVLNQLKSMKITDGECMKIHHVVLELRKESRAQNQSGQALQYYKASRENSAGVTCRQTRAEILMRVVKQALKH